MNTHYKNKNIARSKYYNRISVYYNITPTGIEKKDIVRLYFIFRKVKIIII